MTSPGTGPSLWEGSMKIKKPSPSMAVAFVALVFAMSGTAFAAVNYARNAGAVDGKSAVGSGSSLKRAAGKLVTTQRHGSGKGRIAQKYLDIRSLPGYARGVTGTFGKGLAVQDNQTLAPETIGVVFGLGTLTASCYDQNATPGKEDPATRLVFINQSGTGVNVARSVGGNAPFVGALPNGAQNDWTIKGSNTFELHIERAGVNYFVKGTVRQEGANTADANCLFYGFSLAV
jgi:hypothetical protein